MGFEDRRSELQMTKFKRTHSFGKTLRPPRRHEAKIFRRTKPSPTPSPDAGSSPTIMLTSKHTTSSGTSRGADRRSNFRALLRELVSRSSSMHTMPRTE